jgi:aryl-alcohol dehydrogenase-like predicted oxidoreductase
VATVQNLYNLTVRQSEDVLTYCEEQGIGFIPWFPLASGGLAQPGGAVDEIARAHDAAAGQIALAWLLAKSPVMLPIPGTSSVAHLEENVAAADLTLSESELATLDAAS